MFQQSIVVSKPHMKPVVMKTAAVNEPSSDEESVMPLEYFSGYELELQETILQLSSELENYGDWSSSSDEDESPELSQSATDATHTDSLESSVQETPSSADSREAPDNTYEFTDYELLLEKAVHDLTSLSDVLVGCGT